MKSRSHKPKFKLWESLSSIPIPKGFTQKDLEDEIDREVAAETGLKKKGRKR